MLSQNLINPREFPFASCTDYQLTSEFTNSKSKLLDLFSSNGFSKQINNLIKDFAKDNYKCKYHNYSSFPKLLSEHQTKCLKAIHINLRSLELNKYKLKSYLDTLGCEFDLIFLSETGHANIASVEDIFKGYNLIYQPPFTSKGGAGILIKTNSFDSIIKLDTPKFTTKKTCTCKNCLYENVWVKLKSQSQEIITGAIYRHPGGNIDHFLSSFEHIFSNIKDNAWSIVAGDININLLNVNDDSTSKYVNNCIQANFVPCITLPTRFCETTATLIDPIMVKVPRKYVQTKVSAGNLLVDITDHLPNFVLIDTEISHSKDRPFVRLFTKKKIKKFENEIINYNKLVSLNDNESLVHNNVHASYNDFFLNLVKLLDLFFPLVKLSRSKMKDKPYITPGIKVSIKHRDRLYEKYLNNKNKYTQAAWKSYRNKVSDIIKKSEKLYYQKQLKEHTNSCHGMWKVFGKIIKNKHRHNKINSINVNNLDITSTPLITEEFNKYFCSIGEHLAKKFESNTNFKEYLENKVESSFYLHPTSEQEISRIIDNLNPKKSSGSDDIPIKFVQLCKNIVSNPLKLIFNQTIATGEYPDKLKIAKVLPIFKKGPTNILSNYRPISVLSVLNKIFEKLLCKRLYKFLNKHNVLYKYQFGFRQGHSTSHALIEIMDNVRSAIDNDMYTCGIFIDLSKAFDTVNHAILLEKLHHYGIRGQTNKLFESYLTNRKQLVEIDKIRSTCKPITCGVPQGSVLGPLLFLIYINDMANKCPLGNIRLFADDTNIFLSHSNIVELYKNAQLVLTYLFKWFKDNKLTVNSSKSNFTIFTTPYKRRKVNLPSEIKVNEHKIFISDKIKYLGVIIDEDLTWNDHITHICNSLRKLFPIFYHLRNYLSTDNIKCIYYAMVYSRIKYGIEVWGMTSGTNMGQVQILQNRLLKVLLRKPYRYSTDKLHNELNILKVPDIFKQEIASFMHLFRKGKLPEVFMQYFRTFADIHNINTRNNNLRYITPLECANTLKVKGPQIWNSLDNTIKETDKLKPFRGKIKASFLPY